MTLCWIEIPSSQVSFGKPCGSACGQRSRWAPHSNPKQMGKLRRWTWLSNNFSQKLWRQINKLGGPFGVAQSFATTIWSTRQLGHTFSNGDKQVTNFAYILGCTLVTLEGCKWGSANGHATWWNEATLMGEGQGQSSKGTKMVQGFFKQVSTWSAFWTRDEVWLDIKSFQLPDC